MCWVKYAFRRLAIVSKYNFIQKHLYKDIKLNTSLTDVVNNECI